MYCTSYNVHYTMYNVHRIIGGIVKKKTFLYSQAIVYANNVSDPNACITAFTINDSLYFAYLGR